jgi:hypothetical protein
MDLNPQLRHHRLAGVVRLSSPNGTGYCLAISTRPFCDLKYGSNLGALTSPRYRL